MYGENTNVRKTKRSVRERIPSGGRVTQRMKDDRTRKNMIEQEK